MFKTPDTSLATSGVHAPPGTDLADLARLAAEIGASHVAAEADAEAARFTEEALAKRIGTRASPLLLVSATETLAGGPTRDLAAEVRRLGEWRLRAQQIGGAG